MNKLTKKEIEEALDNEEDIAVYRMYTKKGVCLRMKVAGFYYNHCNIFSYIAIQFPLIIIDAIDIIVFVWEKKKNSHGEDENKNL